MTIEQLQSLEWQKKSGVNVQEAATRALVRALRRDVVSANGEIYYSQPTLRMMLSMAELIQDNEPTA
jgi:hypothetical protein